MGADGAVKVTTNNVPRELVDAWALTPKEREAFDYLDWEAIDDGRDSASFIRYKGELYDLGNFMRLHKFTGDEPDWTDGWEGYASDSFFSGLVIRFVETDYHDVLAVIGRYCS